MARLVPLNAVFRGRLSSYTVIKELYRASEDGAVYLARNLNNEKCIVKSVRGHWRLKNEATVLKKYQSQTPFLRPLIDEIQDPIDPPSIVLRYLDSDMLTECDKKRLSRPEIKQVARCVLEALNLLHKDGMVHTDIKLDNIFVNHDHGPRFSEIQLGDFGGVVSQDSRFARKGVAVGSGCFRSPENILELPWTTAADIWSFGTILLSLLFGNAYHLFNPCVEGIAPDSDMYGFTILKRMHRFFGPFPLSYRDFEDQDTMTIINIINKQEKPLSFSTIPPVKVPPADVAFLVKIMKLDPRDRPTAEELLGDVWFTEESEDTRLPLPERKATGTN